MAATDVSVNMQKWGIPEKEMVSPEITLLERLVWVPYKDHWWPALLYENYTELQAHLYDELDMVLKAQFAVAIMRQMNEAKKIKVARLLGREILEVVEVDDNQFAEFYWQLPRVLPMACKKSRYGNDIKLYLDFHRALDQVEEIIRDISENSFNLMPNEEKKTWLQRAEEALKSPELTTSAPKPQKQKPRQNQRSPTGDSMLDKKAAVKAATDKEESNFLFNALDDMMERINSTYECVSGDVIVADESVDKKASMNAHSEALLKQKEYRKALRDVIDKQRQERTSSNNKNNGGSRNNKSSTTAAPTVEARNPSFDENGGQVRTNISTDVVYNPSENPAVDLSNHSSSADERHQQLHTNRSYSGANREYISSVPELRVSVPKKKMVKNSAPPSQQKTTTVVTETREENPEDDREAIKAAARAAAAVELEATFWDAMTCHTMDS